MIRILLFCSLIALAAGQSNCTAALSQVSLPSGDASSLTQVQIAAMLNSTNITYVDSSKTHFSCFTERSAPGILGAAGGDSGEFVIALAALDYFGGNINSSTLSTLMQTLLPQMNRSFYYPIELGRLSDLLKSSSLQSLNLNSTTLLQLTDTSIQNQVLDAMMNQNEVLSLFLNDILFLDNNAVTIVNRTTVQNFVRTLFMMMWNNSTSSLIYPSLYTRSLVPVSAIVNFASQSSDRCHTYAPLIAPTFNSSLSIFVEHLGFIGDYRDFLARSLCGLVNVNASTFRAQHDKIAAYAYTNFFNFLLLGANPPRFNATFAVTDKMATTTGVASTSGIAVTSSMATTLAMTTGSSMTPAATSSGKGWVAVLIVFILLGLFLGGTYIAWTQYRRFFGSHKSHATPKSPKKAPSRSESDLVPLDEIGSGYGYGGGYGSHDREEQL